MRVYTVQNKQTFSGLLLEGLKLSEKPSFAEKAPWDGDLTVLRCLANFPEKYDKSEATVVRMEVNAEDVFVLEGAFEGLKAEEGSMFPDSKVSAKDYTLGKYIKPVYFITRNVEPENIFPQEDREGDIRFFESEERFYIDCVSAELEEKYDEFKLFSARSLFESLTAAGRMTKIENGDYIIFKDGEGNVYPVCRHFHN